MTKPATVLLREMSSADIEGIPENQGSFGNQMTSVLRDTKDLARTTPVARTMYPSFVSSNLPEAMLSSTTISRTPPASTDRNQSVLELHDASVSAQLNLNSVCDHAVNDFHVGNVHTELMFSAESLNDIEDIRIRSVERLRSMMRELHPEIPVTAKAKDKEKPLTARQLIELVREKAPDLASYADIADALIAVEKQAVKAVEKTMKRTVFAEWLEITPGLAGKGVGRLLASLGAGGFSYKVTEDEDGNQEATPRRGPAQLWAYCGYAPGQQRKKGERINWNAKAKTRCYIVAESVIKKPGPFRDQYLARRLATSEHVHEDLCVRCGPKGHPAQPGTPWSKGHQHADALRVVAKSILRDGFRIEREAMTRTRGER